MPVAGTGFSAPGGGFTVDVVESAANPAPAVNAAGRDTATTKITIVALVTRESCFRTVMFPPSPGTSPRSLPQRAPSAPPAPGLGCSFL